jgi:hypothetical protein
VDRAATLVQKTAKNVISCSRLRLLGALLATAACTSCTPSREVFDPCLVAVDAGPAVGDASADSQAQRATEGSIVGVLADGAVITGLNLVDWSTCPGDLRCVDFATVGADGQCHGVGAVCVRPCDSDQDCAALGARVVCSRACGVALLDAAVSGGVCTPFQ